MYENKRMEEVQRIKAEENFKQFLFQMIRQQGIRTALELIDEVLLGCCQYLRGKIRKNAEQLKLLIQEQYEQEEQCRALTSEIKKLKKINKKLRKRRKWRERALQIQQEQSQLARNEIQELGAHDDDDDEDEEENKNQRERFTFQELVNESNSQKGSGQDSILIPNLYNPQNVLGQELDQVTKFISVKLQRVQELIEKSKQFVVISHGDIQKRKTSSKFYQYIQEQLKGENCFIFGELLYLYNTSQIQKNYSNTNPKDFVIGVYFPISVIYKNLLCPRRQYQEFQKLKRTLVQQKINIIRDQNRQNCKIRINNTTILQSSKKALLFNFLVIYHEDQSPLQHSGKVKIAREVERIVGKKNGELKGEKGAQISRKDLKFSKYQTVRVPLVEYEGPKFKIVMTDFFVI